MHATRELLLDTLFGNGFESSVLTLLQLHSTFYGAGLPEASIRAGRSSASDSSLKSLHLPAVIPFPSSPNLAHKQCCSDLLFSTNIHHGF